MSETQQRGALAGLKIIDLSRVMAGPFCTQMLADHGAEVIKVEPPVGDEARRMGPPYLDGDAPMFHGVNRNKRAIALDLSNPDARPVLFRLLVDADVLVENFKPGTLERWGLGFEEVLQDRFPRLIHCTITGFGVDGPLGGMPGYDPFVQAWSGMMSLNSPPESGPLKIGVPLVDLAVGTNGALGIMLALHQRAVTGRGQHLEVALFDVALSLMVPSGQFYFMTGDAPPPTGNGHRSVAPFGLFETGGRSVMLSATTDRVFRDLCRVLGKAELADDPRFRSNADRLANRAALTQALQDGMVERDGEELALELMRNDVAAGAVLSVADAFDHPHARHRNMVLDVEGAKSVGVPIRLADSGGIVHSHPPRFAEHSEQILYELGFTAEERAAFYAAGAVVVANPPPADQT